MTVKGHYALLWLNGKS